MALTEEQQREIIDLIKRENLYIEYTEHAEWHNFTKNINLPDILLLKIKNLNSAKKLLRKIDELNQRVSPEERISCRPASGGKTDESSQSFSLPPFLGGIDDDKLYSQSFSLPPWVEADILINLEFAASDEYAIEKINETTVRYRPGPQLKAFDTILHSLGLATLYYGSLINRVGPIGLATNGGHGINGPYTENIESITFLMMNGKKKRIDRKSNPDDFDFIVTSHFGLLGIVVEMELKCKPATKLKRIETAMSLAQFIEDIEAGKLPKNMFEVFYSPTCDNDLTNKNINNLKLIEFEEVDYNAENENFEPEKISMEQYWQIKLQDDLRIGDVLAMFPQLGPLYMKYIVARYGIGEGRKESVGDAPYEYHYQYWYPYNINMFAGIFPTDNKLTEMLDALKKVARDTQDAKERGEAPVSFGAYARVCENKGYPCSMSPFSHVSNKEKLCAFDVVSSPHAVGYEKFHDDFMKYLIEELFAKLHWGKDIPLSIDLEKMYPDALPMFRKMVEDFHTENGLKLERSPFLTPFIWELFKMDEKYKPAVQNKDAIDRNQTVAPQTTFNGLTALVRFIEWIEQLEEQDIHTEALKKCAQDIHRQEKAKLPSSGQGFFPPEGGDADNFSKPRPSCTLF